MSGQHVLFGHLSQLASWTTQQHDFVILHHSSLDAAVRQALPYDNAVFVSSPDVTSHWAVRTAWEASRIPSLIRKYSADRYFTPAGTILPFCSVPQISLAQNPWCLVPSIHRTAGERAKALVQRAAYRRAAASADLMVYNSNHIKSLYESNAGNRTRAPSIIAYQGISNELHSRPQSPLEFSQRSPFSVISVSAMAHWKGAEIVVAAIGHLRKKGIPVVLTLIGPWPDPLYEKSIRKQIAGEGLEDAVTIAGKVSVEELHNFYATAHVFCLMSHCESFGIPAVEAQCFGTPVVGSNTCAMSEIGGQGGRFCDPSDLAAVKNHLEELLTNQDAWTACSNKAVENSKRFQWHLCSRPLMQMFESPNDFGERDAGP